MSLALWSTTRSHSSPFWCTYTSFGSPPAHSPSGHLIFCYFRALSFEFLLAFGRLRHSSVIDYSWLNFLHPYITIGTPSVSILFCFPLYLRLSLLSYAFMPAGGVRPLMRTPVHRLIDLCRARLLYCASHCYVLVRICICSLRYIFSNGFVRDIKLRVRPARGLHQSSLQRPC